MRLTRGTVVMVDLNPTIGHEERGVRPCVVVSDAEAVRSQRFPLICVVPVTGTAGVGNLYPVLERGSGGLTKQSFALVDQLRSVDKQRVRLVFGALTQEEVAAIDAGLRMFLGLADACDDFDASTLH